MILSYPLTGSKVLPHLLKKQPSICTKIPGLFGYTSAINNMYSGLFCRSDLQCSLASIGPGDVVPAPGGGGGGPTAAAAVHGALLWWAKRLGATFHLRSGLVSSCASIEPGHEVHGADPLQLVAFLRLVQLARIKHGTIAALARWLLLQL